MGRPPGSRNKPKALPYSEMPAPDGKARKRKAPGPATASPPPPGHNGGDLSDDEQRALLVQGVVEIERLTTQIEALSGTRRAERAKLKIHGIQKHVVDHAIERRKAIKAGKLAEELQKTIDRAKVDRWLNLQPGLTQDLFAPPPSEAAFEAGKLAGMEGLTCKPPDQYGQNDAQRWISGWTEAQTVLAGGITDGKVPPAPSIQNAASADPPETPAPAEPVTEDLRPRFAQQRESDAIDSLLGDEGH
jgi:hypothetical protein